MKVSRLIELLRNFNSDADVVLNDFSVETPVLFVLAEQNAPSMVCIAGEDYCNLADELNARYQYASDNGIDELDFYIELVEDGYTLQLIRKYLGEETAGGFAIFCLEHGLWDKRWGNEDEARLKYQLDDE